MPKRIDEYAARLQERLAKRLPPDVAEQKAAEIRSHLLLAVEGREHADAAEREALAQMGSDYLLAVDIIRSEKGINRRSGWRWVALTCLLMIMGGLLLYGSPKAGLGLQWAGVWTMVVMAGTFFAACLRSRRWLLVPALAVGIVVSAGVVLFDASDRGDLNDRDRTEKIKDFTYELQEAEQRLSKAEFYAAGGGKSEPEYLMAPTQRDVVVRHSNLLWPNSSPEKRTEVRAHRVESLEEATTLWKKNSGPYLATLRNEVRLIKATIQYWKSVPGFFAYILYGIGTWTLIWLVLFTSLNALALGVHFLVRRVYESAWKRQLT